MVCECHLLFAVSGTAPIRSWAMAFATSTTCESGGQVRPLTRGETLEALAMFGGVLPPMWLKDCVKTTIGASDLKRSGKQPGEKEPVPIVTAQSLGLAVLKPSSVPSLVKRGHTTRSTVRQKSFAGTISAGNMESRRPTMKPSSSGREDDAQSASRAFPGVGEHLLSTMSTAPAEFGGSSVMSAIRGSASSRTVPPTSRRRFATSVVKSGS